MKKLLVTLSMTAICSVMAFAQNNSASNCCVQTPQTRHEICETPAPDCAKPACETAACAKPACATTECEGPACATAECAKPACAEASCNECPKTPCCRLDKGKKGRCGKPRHHKKGRNYRSKWSECGTPVCARAMEGISLTPSQQAEIEKLNADRRSKADKEAKSRRDKRIKEAKKYNEKMKSILTPEQYAKYQDNLKKNQPAAPRRIVHTQKIDTNRDLRYDGQAPKENHCVIPAKN